MENVLQQLAQQVPGKGRDDDVPAMLSEGEYVIPADVVALLGQGNSEAGAKILDDFVQKIKNTKPKDLKSLVGG